jgi:hypothetical protein
MGEKSKELEKVLKNHIETLLKDMVLTSKIDTYYDSSKGEDFDITTYFDSKMGKWLDKDDAIKSNIQISLNPFIDKILKENKDLIKFFI